MDKPTQKEVEMFLIAIQKNPPTMNLNGYANILIFNTFTSILLIMVYLDLFGVYSYANINRALITSVNDDIF